MTAEILAILKAAENKELSNYRAAVSSWPVNMPATMSQALGSGTRRMIPFASVVVDVISSKLEVNRAALTTGTATETKVLRSWLADDTFPAIERELWKLVVRDGKAYVLVNWVDNAPAFSIIPAYDTARGAGSGPGYTFNYWSTETHEYFDMYYPAFIAKYIRDKKEKDWQPRQDSPDEGWPIPWIDNERNPLGSALIEFSIGNSDIATCLQLNRDLNDAVIDMIAVSRTQGWPQRFLSGGKNAEVVTNGLGQPIINSHTGQPIRRQIVLTPGSVVNIGESTLGQLPVAKAEPGLVDKLLELFSFVTSVPVHYFTGGWPSGAALERTEARINHKVEAHQTLLSQPLAQMLTLMMRLHNVYAPTGPRLKDSLTITIPWYSPQVETESIRAERKAEAVSHVISLYESKLMSLRTALETLHPDWPSDHIDEEMSRITPAI